MRIKTAVKLLKEAPRIIKTSKALMTGIEACKAVLETKDALYECYLAVPESVFQGDDDREIPAKDLFIKAPPASKAELEAFSVELARSSVQELSDRFVPLFYQRGIHELAEQIHSGEVSLTDAGIRLVTIRIDGALAPNGEKKLPSSSGLQLDFRYLSWHGVKVALLTEDFEQGINFTCALHADFFAPMYTGAPGGGLALALQAYEDKYGERLEPSQILHIGTDLWEDVHLATEFGACAGLVRPAALPLISYIPDKESKRGRMIRERLEECRAWFVHHQSLPDDQYYLPGEVPEYLIDGSNILTEYLSGQDRADAEAFLRRLSEQRAANREEDALGAAEFRAELARMTDDELKAKYIPDVYQPTVADIDYQRLYEKGIRVLTYDIDDTLCDVLYNNLRGRLPFARVTMPKEIKELFVELKRMGFTVILLTNAIEKVASDTCRELNAHGYISKARKPGSANFEVVIEQYCDGDRSRLAHIGNSVRDDVAGGNGVGVTTCLVRRAGVSEKIGKGFMLVVGRHTKGHYIRAELEKRGLWRKHHKDKEGDQFYQLDEMPPYLRRGEQK